MADMLMFVRYFTVKARLAGLATICLTASIICAGVGLWSANRLTDLSGRVFVSKDVVADILPPPLYLIEMRLVLSRLMEKSLEPATAGEQIEKLAKEYDDRIQYWTANPPYGLERHLLGAQHEAGKRFIEASRAAVAKAKADGVDSVRGELTKLHELYETHRKGVDVTVVAGTEFAAGESKNFAAVVSASRMILQMTTVAAFILTALLFTLVARSILQPLGTLVETIKRIAEGDLSCSIQVVCRDEVAKVGVALCDMQASLTKLVNGFRANAESVAMASVQLAQSNKDLAGHTSKQSHTLQQTAATMGGLGVTVTNNADNAMQANQLALGASSVAVKGGRLVTDVVETMKGINASSKKIADIISVIDSIAFQTNILALNAAVEAARASEQGRGFAVVAGEVRSLAQRSAEAAKEIKALIAASVERVEQGTTLVDQAGQTMNEIVGSIKQVTDIVGEISTASAEQNTRVSQVGQAVSAMDAATSHNASLVEETAAVAESLKDQAQQLMEALAVFKVNSRPQLT